LIQEELYATIEGCTRNDRLCQESLYKFFYNDMFRVCQRYTEQPHDALTILNDAFLKVFRSIAQYNKDLGNFKSWLKTIVINTAIDHIRQRKKDIRIIHIDQVQEQGDDDFQLNYNWKQEEILQHFNFLPTVTRTVVNLFAFDGYSHKDIAEQLDISETTSRWHLSEARKRLKKSLQLKQSKMVKYEWKFTR
jgi:RNA polymerase sigma factor (sigma-70 family)